LCGALCGAGRQEQGYGTQEDPHWLGFW
jgi:hypothetical protein